MQIAILLYEEVTALEAVGSYEVLSRVPGVETVFVADRARVVRCDSGVRLLADAAMADVTSPDIVVVPGWSSASQRDLLAPGPTGEWLRAVDETTTWTSSSSTGSLVLASAGILTGRRATTHWLAVDDLARWGAIPVAERVVIDDKYVTSAGVSAAIDMALALVAAIADDVTARAIQLAIEYDPQPPFDSGSPAKAPPQIVEAMRAVKNFIVYDGSGLRDAESLSDRRGLDPASDF